MLQTGGRSLFVNCEPGLHRIAAEYCTASDCLPDCCGNGYTVWRRALVVSRARVHSARFRTMRQSLLFQYTIFSKRTTEHWFNSFKVARENEKNMWTCNRIPSHDCKRKIANISIVRQRLHKSAACRKINKLPWACGQSPPWQSPYCCPCRTAWTSGATDRRLIRSTRCRRTACIHRRWPGRHCWRRRCGRDVRIPRPECCSCSSTCRTRRTFPWSCNLRGSSPWSGVQPRSWTNRLRRTAGVSSPACERDGCGDCCVRLPCLFSMSTVYSQSTHRPKYNKVLISKSIFIVVFNIWFQVTQQCENRTKNNYHTQRAEMSLLRQQHIVQASWNVFYYSSTNEHHYLHILLLIYRSQKNGRLRWLYYY